MIGLTKLTDKILSDARADAEKLISEAQKRAEEISSENDKKINDLKLSVESDIASERENIISRANSTSSMEQRNILLSVKGKALDDAFSASVDAVCNLSSEEYIAFIIGNASSAIEDTKPAACVLSFAKKDLDQTAEKVCGILKSAFADINFSISSKPADIKGGVLLDFGKTDVDCSVETVISQVRPMLEQQVCKILFDRNK